MKKIFFLFCFCSLFYSAFNQSFSSEEHTDTVKNEKQWTAWVNDLYEMGMEIKNDSIKMNGECKRIVRDTNYRKIIYPKNYSWDATTYLLKSSEFKKAFWYLINLYAADTANKLMVIRSLVPFDAVIEMDKALTGTFYTYALLNPEVSTLVNNKYQIMHPELLEDKFKKVKEMIEYILYYRHKAKEETTR